MDINKNGSYVIQEQGDLGLGTTAIDESMTIPALEKKSVNTGTDESKKKAPTDDIY